MLQFTLREAARFVLGLLGAALMAAAISGQTESSAWHGIGPFVATAAARLGEFLHLKFGFSAVSGRPAIAELAERLPPTFALATAGVIVAILVGTPLGLLFGTGPVRRAATPLIQVVTAMPVFCAGLLLAWLAHNLLHWPTTMNGNAALTEADFRADPAVVGKAFKVLLLPVLTVGAAGAASVQLSLRRAAAEVATEPYRTGLRRLGLGALEIERVYATPQVFAGFLDNLGELTLYLFAAAAVAEWVFNCPGAAVLFVKSVALSDWNMAALILFVFAATKLAADLLGHVAARALANPGVHA